MEEVLIGDIIFFVDGEYFSVHGYIFRSKEPSAHVASPSYF